MNIIDIKETPSSPAITLNTDSGEFSFVGRSLPEDPIEFYDPILDWFDAYTKDHFEGAIFEFKLSYFNTASSKVFFNIFQLIDKLNVEKPGANNKIVIYTNDDDEDLMELFEYYQELLSSNCLELKIY